MKLTGNVVVFTASATDLYYDCPDLEGAELISVNKEDDNGTLKTQLLFKLKNGREWSVLFLPSVY